MLDHTIHIFSHTVVMQMSVKKTDRITEQSKLLMSVMSGEEKMYYLERMWDLYFEVYAKNKWRKSTFASRKKNPPMKEKKAYELLTGLVKIFGH